LLVQSIQNILHVLFVHGFEQRRMVGYAVEGSCRGLLWGTVPSFERKATAVAACLESRARFEPSASRKPVRSLTWQVRGTHNLPLVHSVTEHITSMQHSVRAVVFLCILGVLVSASVNKLSHPKVRTPRGIVCRRLLGGSARAHLYPYSMDSASLTQCGRDVTSRRVFPSSPLRWTHLIPPEGRLGHVVCVWVGLGHCLLTAAMSSLDDKQRLSRISVSGPQDEVWNGQARCCLQSRYYVSLSTSGLMAIYLVIL